MAEIWFSSDHHFGHKNIIQFCGRPFPDTIEMDEQLVIRHNAYVRPNDHWYCLGDVTMERDTRGDGLVILDRMNGHRRLIMGNHDHYHVSHYLKYFEKVMAMNVIDNIRFTHIPVHPASMGGVRANVHGHIHNNQDGVFQPVMRVDKVTQKITMKPYINISVEVTDYRPVNLEEIREMIRKAGGE